MEIFRKTQFLLLLLLFGVSTTALSQQEITIKGTVIDKETKDPIPLASVYFVGTTVGTDTDFDGNFEFTTSSASDTLAASYIGYNEQKIVVPKGSKVVVINFEIEEVFVTGTTVEVKTKRVRYKRKDNPAIALMKKVQKNIEKNRPQSADYYEFDKYEKIQLDLNNITEKFRNRKAFKDFQFIFDYVDTSDINGKAFLPVYIRESASKVYHRKDPKSKKEFRSGVKISGLEDFVNSEGFSTVTDMLYKDIDIFERDIKIFDKQFLSPLTDLGIDFNYRYYIIDTIQMDGREVIHLEFTPAFKQAIAFDGSLYVSNDEDYAIVKAKFGVPKQINLNFVNALRFEQSFKPNNDVWILDKDEITVDFSPVKKGMGFFATRSVTYDNHLFNIERDADKYRGSELLIEADDVYKKDEKFWDNARLDTMSAKELGIYEMIDTLQQVPAFKRVANVLGLLVTGYQTVGKVDIGNIGAFYSFNPVEGFRLRFGGQTNLKFNKKIQLEGYGAYGFKDEQFKYAGAFLYSFNEDFQKFPKHYVRFSHQHDTKFVGQQLRFVQEDNFLLSFKRGTNDRLLLQDKSMFEYFLEFKNNLSFDFNYAFNKQRPLGSLNFDYFNPEIGDFDTYKNLQTSEFGLRIRFAPNQQFIQGRNYRRPIYNKHPIMALEYNLGVDGLGGDFQYQKLSFHIIKRFYLSIFGMTRFEGQAGRIWADGVPYFFLHFPTANQTFAYRTGAFNMMNFMEFANDKWALVIAEHFFDGLFFNRIPLLKKLKLREVVSFKAIYGSLDDKNNPNINPELVQFIKDEDTGQAITTTLDEKPYMEASVGIYNIFKVIRVDFVKRLNYLDRPDVPEMFGVKGLGLRMKVKLEF